MSTTVTSVTNHFPSPQDGFTTTTSGSVASGASSVGLNSVSGYTNGQIVVMVIDPAEASKKQAFTGTIDISGVQITNVVWTSGTNQSHQAGATVVDYATATHIAMMTKGLLVSHDQDGTLKSGAVDVAAVLASNVVTTDKILNANVTSAKLVEAFARGRYQNLTTNTTQTGLTIQHGFSFINNDGTAASLKAITFPVAFTTIYNVFVTLQGSKAGSDPTDITDLVVGNISDGRSTIVGASSVSTTGFTATISDSASPSGTRSGFSWMAIGVV